jgi:hypothetical protein
VKQHLAAGGVAKVDLFALCLAAANNLGIDLEDSVRHANRA